MRETRSPTTDASCACMACTPLRVQKASRVTDTRKSRLHKRSFREYKNSSEKTRVRFVSKSGGRMQRAIKCTCSHCQRESYFDASASIPLEAISGSTCTRCGKTGAVITLNVDLPVDAVLQDRVPHPTRQQQECNLH